MALTLIYGFLEENFEKIIESRYIGIFLIIGKIIDIDIEKNDLSPTPNGKGKMTICILSGKRLNELSLYYQLEGGLECSVNVEVLLAKKAEALPQLGLPGEEVESPTNPAEGQKSGVK